MTKRTSADTRIIMIDLHRKGKSLRERGKLVGRYHCTADKYTTRHAVNPVQKLQTKPTRQNIKNRALFQFCKIFNSLRLVLNAKTCICKSTFNLELN